MNNHEAPNNEPKSLEDSLGEAKAKGLLIELDEIGDNPETEAAKKKIAERTKETTEEKGKRLLAAAEASMAERREAKGKELLAAAEESMTKLRERRRLLDLEEARANIENIDDNTDDNTNKKTLPN
jgi:hypothetical protein